MNIRSIVSALALAVPACASVHDAVPVATVPDNLKPAANEALSMIASAKGVQSYECRAAGRAAGAYEWAFVAPHAELSDANGRTIGRHYAGPRWEAADGSAIEGRVEQRADAARAGAIPWLLLATKSVGPQGSFSGITHVQRINTVGGAAPQSGCSQASIGAVAYVAYTADYYFFAAANGTASDANTRPSSATLQRGYYEATERNTAARGVVTPAPRDAALSTPAAPAGTSSPRVSATR